MLDEGVDVNAVDIYGTVLAVAAFKGDTEFVSLLLERGADVNVSDEYGTALAAAAHNGKIDTVSLLLDREADVNKEGGRYGTALAVAVYKEATKIVSLLLDRGADVNIVSGGYWTICGAVKNREDLLNKRQYLPSPISANWHHRSPPLLLPEDFGEEGGMTVLAQAAYARAPDTVSLLLDRGADVNMVGGKYGTALVAASDRYLVAAKY